MLFLSTPSARRATGSGLPPVYAFWNFYPRPPRGGRRARTCGNATKKAFLSTPSARRATATPAAAFLRSYYFYPRPPRGGRPTKSSSRSTERSISIHALREEGDAKTTKDRGRKRKFLSTPSARRATIYSHSHFRHRGGISIHALREEGDDILKSPLNLL